jgi:hypothetical protein
MRRLTPFLLAFKMSMKKPDLRVLLFALTVLLGACRDSTSTATLPATTSDLRTNPAGKWLGQWNGPEGTFLDLAQTGNHYVVKIRSLDSLDAYDGVATAGGIQFTRNGKAESIRTGNGEDTGMKWLLDKKNCLIIKYGEGFCRD